MIYALVAFALLVFGLFSYAEVGANFSFALISYISIAVVFLFFAIYFTKDKNK